MLKKAIESVFIIVSTIVGFGVFLLPYALQISGGYFWIWFIVVALAVYELHLAYGELLFDAKEKHNLPGLISQRLGKHWKLPVWIFDYVGILLVLLLFLVALSQFVPLVLPVSALTVKAFFALLFVLVGLLSVNPFANIKTVFSIAMIFLFAILSGLLFPYVRPENLVWQNSQYFFSYGLLVFAFIGYSSLQMVYDLIGPNAALFRRVNKAALMIVSALYLFVTASVVGVLGNTTAENSLVQLVTIFGPAIGSLSIALAMVSMSSVAFSLVFYIKRGLMVDFKIKEFPAWCAIAVPLILFVFIPLQGVVQLADLIGGLFLSVNILLLLVAYDHIKHKKYFHIHPILLRALILLFAIGWVVSLAL